MARAQAIATGARHALGAIVRIEEQGSSAPMPPRPVMMRMAAGAQDNTPTPVTPGEIEVHSQVTLTIEIR